jgi:hypothetical protein
MTQSATTQSARTRSLRHFLLVAGMIVAVMLAVEWLADATQTRPDEHQRRSDARTEIVIDLDAQHYRQDLATGALALWASCAATVSGTLTAPGIANLGNGRFRLAIRPALGEHSRRRLLGCLGDMTIDRLRGHIVSVTDRRLPS